MRVATWNVNSLKARLERVEAWMLESEPDVLCLQETKLADDAFPALTFQSMGYEGIHYGQGRWNGVAILSRVGLEDVQVGFADGLEEDPEARLVWATCSGVRIASVYVPNGRSLDDEKFVYKLSFLDRLHRALERDARGGEAMMLCGDFNVAPDDRDVWDPAAFVGATHVSSREREAIERLRTTGFEDLFRLREGDGGVYSWWDYRAGNFHKGKGMRIDLVLGTAPVAARLHSVAIDRDARKGPSPSDHAPVVVDLLD